MNFCEPKLAQSAPSGRMALLGRRQAQRQISSAFLCAHMVSNQNVNWQYNSLVRSKDDCTTNVCVRHKTGRLKRIRSISDRRDDHSGCETSQYSGSGRPVTGTVDHPALCHGVQSLDESTALCGCQMSMKRSKLCSRRIVRGRFQLFREATESTSFYAH
jgi:hypothetical protein